MLVPMPETTVNKYHKSCPVENEIRLAWQLVDILCVIETFLIQQQRERLA